MAPGSFLNLKLINLKLKAMIKKTSIVIILFLLGIAFFSSCKRELPTYYQYDSYIYSTNDENGGNWKPILLSSNEQIVVPTPEASSSAAYKAELASLKTLVDKASTSQQAAVTYWSNNPINRWSEIALELIAKYNLTVGPNADGTYPSPNPANPSAYPKYPYSHPPYASRALAYLSVAQFDGLITAWHYKYKYNRAAPYVQDPSIKYAYLKNVTPSYPSDGAVIAETSKEILAVMFPNERAYLQKLEDENLQSLLISGGNTQSDIDAGRAIGSQIASIALTRAASDGMKNAQVSKTVADSISNSAFERFGWRWENMEIPKRPVGQVPFLCYVKLWNVPKVQDVRPPVPPAPGSKEFEAAADLLRNYEQIQTEDHSMISSYWADGIETYTPPGHWNRFTKEFIVKYKLNPLRSARTYAYTNMALMDAGICCWDAKYYYNYPRPIQLLDNLKTIAGTPNFPSYPSGHSTFSAAAATVLSYIFPQEKAVVEKYAEEAGISRLYGLIHFSFDNSAGAEQGSKVGGYTVNKAKADGAD